MRQTEIPPCGGPQKTIGLSGHMAPRFLNNYMAAVQACGAQALLLNEEQEGLLCRLDGVIFMGGVDLNPALYHEENLSSRGVDDALDSAELARLRLALEYKKPILGICRGLQLINVFFGGSLIQDLTGPQQHRRLETGDSAHGSQVKPGSFLHQIYCQETLRVNSAHHQAAKALGEGLEAVQYSDDGVVEALRHQRLPVFAVQWHPERMCLKNARADTADGLRLFRWFMDQCHSG